MPQPTDKSENMFDFYCVFLLIMLYYMYERKSNIL